MTERETMAHEPPRKVSFDPTINLGHVLTMLTLLGGLAAGWSSLNTRLDYVEKAMGNVADLVTRSVRADVRLDNFERRMERIENRPEN